MGRNIRPPTKLDEYLPAAEALDRLDELRAAMSERSRTGDLMRWDITLSFWNPSWNDPATPQPDLICTQTRFKSGKAKS